eukprot:9350086-Karenia_brevis.AAC.1
MKEGIFAGGSDSKSRRQVIFAALQDPHLREGRPTVVRENDRYKWCAAIQSGVTVMEAADFSSECTIASDVVKMESLDIHVHKVRTMLHLPFHNASPPN